MNIQSSPSWFSISKLFKIMLWFITIIILFFITGASIGGNPIAEGIASLFWYFAPLSILSLVMAKVWFIDKQASLAFKLTVTALWCIFLLVVGSILLYAD